MWFVLAEHIGDNKVGVVGEALLAWSLRERQPTQQCIDAAVS